MKKIYLAILLCVLNLEAVVYENAENGSTSKWRVTDATPKNAKVKNINDKTLHSKVIQLKGKNYDNQYTIGGEAISKHAWNEKEKRYFKFSLKNKQGFLLDLILETTNGVRYLRYVDDDSDTGLDENYIVLGLGYDAADNRWHNYERDIVADLKKFDPNNEIIAVHGLAVRANCRIDNIELTDKPAEPSKPSGDEVIIYEDAEDGKIDRWSIVDNDPAGATVTNVLDSDLNSKVIKLHGTDSYENRYELTNIGSNRTNLNLKWDMKTTEGFIIDVVVMTSAGERALRYNDSAETNKGIDGDTIFHGVGFFATNGSWHTYKRDLQKDLAEFEPNNKVLLVKTFLIRANCSLDNLELFSSPSKIYEDAEDGKITRWKIYDGPKGAKITNKYDKTLKSKVISLKGASYDNMYIIGGDMYDDNGWNDTKHTHLKWSMKNSDGYIVSVLVKTKNGNRYIAYDDSSFVGQSRDGEDISYGLGYASTDGEWHTYIRDIELDLKQLEADNELISIEGMIIIGSVEIDDLELFKIYHSTPNSAGFALTFDDHDVEGWYSMRDIFLEYGMKPTFFVDQFYTLSKSQIDKLKILESDGAEIGCHTYDHAGIERDFHSDVTLIDQYLNEQIIPSLDDMHAAGFNPTSLAYPYGEHESHYDAAVREYLPYLRTTASDKERELSQLNEIFHKKGKNYNILAADGLDNSYNNELAEIKEAFIKASRNGETITLYTHQVVDDPNNDYAISPTKLEKLIQYSKELGLKSYTFKEAYLISE